MEHAEETLKHLVAERLKALNTNAFAIEVASGLPEDAVRSILRGTKKSGTTLNKAKAVCDALGIEFHIGPKRPPARPVELRVISNHDPDQDAPTGFLTIPWTEKQLGSGSAPVAFSRAWLTRHQLVPDFLQAVIPDRFAIAPAPDRGTVALLDTRIAQREGPGLWCYRDAGRVTVAHMTFRDDLAVVHPANPADEALVYKGRSAVLLGLLGKVVWLGQLVPLKGKVD